MLYYSPIRKPVGGILSMKQMDADATLGVCDRTVRRWDRDGWLRGNTVGGVRLYLREEVERFAKSPKAKQTPSEAPGRRITTYFFRASVGGPIKIGISTSVRKRLDILQTSHYQVIECIGIIKGNREEEFHQRFANLRIRGEWFQDAPELLEFIGSEAKPMPPKKARR